MAESATLAAFVSAVNEHNGDTTCWENGSVSSADSIHSLDSEDNLREDKHVGNFFDDPQTGAEAAPADSTSESDSADDDRLADDLPPNDDPLDAHNVINDGNEDHDTAAEALHLKASVGYKQKYKSRKGANGSITRVAISEALKIKIVHRWQKIREANTHQTTGKLMHGSFTVLCEYRLPPPITKVINPQTTQKAVIGGGSHFFREKKGPKHRFRLKK